MYSKRIYVYLDVYNYVLRCSCKCVHFGYACEKRRSHVHSSTRPYTNRCVYMHTHTHLFMGDVATFFHRLLAQDTHLFVYGWHGHAYSYLCVYGCRDMVTSSHIYLCMGAETWSRLPSTHPHTNRWEYMRVTSTHPHTHTQIDGSTRIDIVTSTHRRHVHPHTNICVFIHACIGIPAGWTYAYMHEHVRSFLCVYLRLIFLTHIEIESVDFSPLFRFARA